MTARVFCAFLNYKMIEQYLVVGVKITTKLQQALDQCIPAYQIYFKENNPDYLQIYNINGEQILGKMVKPGVNLETLEDYARNVRSIIKKICPGINLPESEIKIYAQTLIG